MPNHLSDADTFYRLHHMCRFFMVGKRKCKGKTSKATDIHQKNDNKSWNKIKLTGQSGCHSRSTDCGYDFKKCVTDRETLHAADCERCGKSGKQIGTKQGGCFCDRIGCQRSSWRRLYRKKIENTSKICKFFLISSFFFGEFVLK